MNQSKANEEASNLIPQLDSPPPANPYGMFRNGEQAGEREIEEKKNGNETKHGSLQENKILLKSIARNIWGMGSTISLLKSSRQLLNVKVNLHA